MGRPKIVSESEQAIERDKKKQGQKQRDFDCRVSALVRALLDAQGVPRAAFARRIGFAQGNISGVLSLDNEKENRKHWSVPLLLSAAEFFRVTVGELVGSAEAFEKNPNIAMPRLLFASRNTAEHSKERLQRLVWATVGYDPDNVKKEDRFLCELAYGVAQLEIGNPEFCQMYYSGRMGDDDVLAAFDHAIEESHRPEKLGPNDPPLPLWAALKEYWRKPEEVKA